MLIVVIGDYGRFPDFRQLDNFSARILQEEYNPAFNRHQLQITGSDIPPAESRPRDNVKIDKGKSGE
jgi:hypothetical protein